MRRPVIVILGLLAVVAGTGCGSRVDPQATTVAQGPGPAPVAPGVGLGGATTTISAPAIAPTTTTSTASSAAPTSTAASPTTASPSTKATTATTGSASTTVAGLGDKKAYCAAAKTYSVDDLLGLGSRIVADPVAFLAAYEAMAGNAPGDQVGEVKALGPLTRTAVSQVQKGDIKTPEALQSWLANTAPRADLEEWVRSQQTLVPKLKTYCA